MWLHRFQHVQLSGAQWFRPSFFRSRQQQAQASHDRHSPLGSSRHDSNVSTGWFANNPAFRFSTSLRATSASGRKVSNEMIVGIDLGTTNSCVSYVDKDGVPTVLLNPEGRSTTPSVVAYVEENGKYKKLVGESAKRQAITNPLRTVTASKRLIGRKFMEFKPEELRLFSYKVVEGPNGDAYVRIGDRDVSPAEIAADILDQMRLTAELRLGCPVNQAVVTVPAYFNDAQRQATRQAGQICGLEVVRIINEPTAAALAYGVAQNEGKVIAVYDLGGGTFDVSVLEIEAGVFEVKSTAGDTRLGGEDFDELLVSHIVEDYREQSGIDLTRDAVAMQRVREAAEQAKRELDHLPSTEIRLPYLATKDGVPHNMHLVLHRQTYEHLVDSLIKRTLAPCTKALMDAHVTNTDISDVVLVGGMTRMPKVVAAVRQFFAQEPYRGVNPDEAVSIGAAIQASVLRGGFRDLLLLDVCSMTLGFKLFDGTMARMIERNTPVPARRQEMFTTVEDYATSVTIEVCQGDSYYTRDNLLLGMFQFSGLLPRPRGASQIEMTFEIDINGCVNVRARDVESGAVQGLSIRLSAGLSDAELRRLQGQHNVPEEIKQVEARQRQTEADVEAIHASVMAETAQEAFEGGEKTASSQQEPKKEDTKDVTA